MTDRREKLALKGAESLSNSELLAILINNGSVEKSAVDLAKELLAAVENNLQRLAKLSVKDMVNLKIKGLGAGKGSYHCSSTRIRCKKKYGRSQKGGNTIK
ncbi:MAG: UPF0758 domain-containing protein [Segetibacter sp.]